MSVPQVLIDNADKVKFNSLASLPQIVSYYDGSGKTFSIAGASNATGTITIPHGLTSRPFAYVLFSINGTGWFQANHTLYVSGQTDYMFVSWYVDSTNLVISGVNLGSGPSARTVYVRYWLFI